MSIILVWSFNPSCTLARVGHGNSDIRDGKEDDPSLGVSSMIPSLSDTDELAHLSSMVYAFRKIKYQGCDPFQEIFDEYVKRNTPPQFMNPNATYKCHMYERDEEDTKVLIVSKTMTYPELETVEGYVAVIYAGTDDFRTALTDANVRSSLFGPEGVNGTHPLSPSDDIYVHAGFNNAVFSNGLFDRVRNTLNVVQNENPMHRMYTTGHSLGAAASVLTAVAMKLQAEWEDELIFSINFGCPKTGNTAWRDFTNSIEGLGIFRVVNGHDLVARLPDIRFHHAGHTLQLDRSAARIYWLHDGDENLGYSGIYYGWSAFSYALAPEGAYQHIIGHYIKYLGGKSVQDESKYYVEAFEKLKGYDDDNIHPPDSEVDDDIGWDDMPYDDVHSNIMEDHDDIVNIFAQEYLSLLEVEASDGVDLLHEYTDIE